MVLKSLVQSKAVFLATVNGMPKSVEKEMLKMYHTFLWNGKAKGLMKWKQVINKRSQGGLGIPDISIRMEAIEIMWIKMWLNPKATRPRWAFIMDMILNESITKKPIVDRESRINWLGQFKRMLKVVRKYNISAAAPKYDGDAKKSLQLWHNTLMK